MPSSRDEWRYLRGGFLVVGLLTLAALVSWAIQTATSDDPAFERTRSCLVNEKKATVGRANDPIAGSAELGALRTVIETNGVTISVAGSTGEAARLVAAYRAVGGALGPRLELRGRTVYLWDRAPSPTQRQTLFDCHY